MGQAKTYHGMTKARFRGLVKVHVSINRYGNKLKENGKDVGSRD